LDAIRPGDRVRFREDSTLPTDWKLPADAIGEVKRRHIEPSTGRAWLDIDFGTKVGFLFAADPAEFEPADRFYSP
jgi:hypothetical protein